MSILKEKPWIWRIPFLMILIAGSVYAIRSRQGLSISDNTQWHQNEGAIFGTFYHTTYQSDHDLQNELKAALDSVDNSLSMFNPNSTLSKINKNTSNTSDDMLQRVFTLAQQVSRTTDGSFDVTVAPLVNAWGFGFKNGAMPDSADIDSLRSLIGWQQVTLKDGKIIKQDPRIVMDFSAIAKGFGCDVVADMFRRNGVKNFMIEIGGEVVVEGCNRKGAAWRVGVSKPTDDTLNINEELEEVLQLHNQAMATSGNYRNFYITKDGRKVAHTIDPHTGYPVQHSILSATVLAPTCAEADAFATSFMVMGLDKAKRVLQKQKQLSVYLIYDVKGENRVYSTIQQTK